MDKDTGTTIPVAVEAPRSAKRPVAHFEPLSASLARILETDSSPGQLTLNQLLERTEGRGVYLVIIILCLPFIAPASIPGPSTVVGLIVALLAVRLALGKPPRFPHRFGDRQLPPALQKVIRTGGLKFLRFLERGVRPRRTPWLTWRAAQVANATLIAIMALALALPLPPFPPFSNALPTYAIILLAVSMMEEDGVMIWAGYAFFVGTFVYFAFWAGVLATYFGKWYQALFGLLVGAP